MRNDEIWMNERGAIQGRHFATPTRILQLWWCEYVWKLLIIVRASIGTWKFNTMRYIWDEKVKKIHPWRGLGGGGQKDGWVYLVSFVGLTYQWVVHSTIVILFHRHIKNEFKHFYAHNWITYSHTLEDHTTLIWYDKSSGVH